MILLAFLDFEFLINTSSFQNYNKFVVQVEPVSLFCVAFSKNRNVLEYIGRILISGWHLPFLPTVP